MYKHFALIILLLVLLAAVSINQRGQELNANNHPDLANFTPLNQRGLPNQMQHLLDSISQAALNNQWATAAHDIERLERTWNDLKPEHADKLNFIKETDKLIQVLHYNVWGRDPSGVLNTCRKLTTITGELANTIQKRE